MRVIERFLSLDGEGPTMGELALFIRFAGCNLRCRWCDTTYSWDDSIAGEELSPQDIYAYIQASGIHNVTLTGGEPLLQQDILPLLQQLSQDQQRIIHIETNGAIDIAPFQQQCSSANIHYILDYKLPDSLMEEQMCLANLQQVGAKDVYKFVISSERDLHRAITLVNQYQLAQRCQVYFSPVREEINPLTIVEAMKAEKLNGVRLQLQLHKLLWPKEMRGV